MYLKQLDILGFKSFAERTRLTFEPGMIAIVGPNGCGKSNVSDAIRWVLGEQRPTALRCSKLVDVVFNGTDTRKPLGLAEVSITFADCEAQLGTDFHEVTVTRRVSRAGEGQYFINKNPARLKDVQRLFMGTGIGTTSYSVMAQGQIDAILSSKPEDRRAVFEEAAGITKFKADRKEAIRKIEQTEQNLLREADVLREMKRQIGSLQRQVGKAKRYKELRDELRGLDVYLTKGRILAFTAALEANAAQTRAAEESLANGGGEVAAAEEAARRVNASIHEAEERLSSLASEAAAADSAYARAGEMISLNEGRIGEYRAWQERDRREIEGVRRQLEELGMQADSLSQKAALLERGLETAREGLEDAEQSFASAARAVDELRTRLQQARSESAACDRRGVEIRSQLAALEAKAREAILKRERLSAEEARLRETAESAAASAAETRARLDAAKTAEDAAAARAEGAEEAREAFAAELENLRANFGKMQADAAAREAQLKLLRGADDAFAAGAKALLDPANPLSLPQGAILGPLADFFEAPSDFRTALEAVLRAWLDAVVAKDASSAREAVAALFSSPSGGSARIFAADAADVPQHPALPLPELLENVSVSPLFSAGRVLLAGVYVAGSADEVPSDIPAGATVVTRDGAVYRAGGACEAWRPGNEAASPLTRRMLMRDLEAGLEELEAKISAGRETLATGAERSALLDAQVRESRAALDSARRAAAQAEGEYTTVSRSAADLAARLANVRSELAAAEAEDGGDSAARAELASEAERTAARREALIAETEDMEAELRRKEEQSGEESRRLTERRIAVNQMESELNFTAQQAEASSKRRTELEGAVSAREEGIAGYEESVGKLRGDIERLRASLEPLQERAAAIHAKAEAEKALRTEAQAEYARAEAAAGAARAKLDETRAMKSRLEVAAAEATMRRQNLFEHLFNEYGIAADHIAREPDPEWPRGEPPPESEIAARVERLTAEIQELGPVNMVAIDEFRELEERYTREKAQEADLLAAKERILELIANLNATSGEMFRSTFEKANENFRTMFTKLFNGGEARLVLLENSEDPLDAGIDIIARPPGKRPQSVTLLSGGERTMTAVALLFAIFMIKPAPFCMLDELDAALDDSNIGRFVQALKDFLDRSQFLIITHNQHTIAGSDLVYGVSQQEKGVSRIISMRLTDIGVKPPPDDAQTPPRGAKRRAGAKPAAGSGDGVSEEENQTTTKEG